MDLNPTLLLAPQLAAAVTERAALIAGGSMLTDSAVMALDKRASILAADLTAALEAEQSFRPWTPHEPRNTK
jgi:UDP-N-acetylglucosamine enolpyruvyl transferase